MIGLRLELATRQSAIIHTILHDFSQLCTPDTRWSVQDALKSSYFRGAMATQEEITAYLDSLHLTR